MPDTARVLQFPRRRARRSLSPEEARAAAVTYLAMPSEDRESPLVSSTLSDPDTFLAVCALLKEKRNAQPALVAAEASALYEWLSRADNAVGVFDERDYFLGEAALSVGATYRLLGRREEAELWLDRAEAGFRHTVNAAPVLANVSYARLSLHFDKGLFERVLELLPSLATSFAKLGMQPEVLKCRFMEAASLKNLSRTDEARARLEALLGEPRLNEDQLLRGLVLANLGEILSTQGRFNEAVGLFREAIASNGSEAHPLVRAQLKVAYAESLREIGELSPAVESYRAAVTDYTGLGIHTLAAYLRVVLSETLLALGRPREAEWEILQALPTIEEQKMVPEGFAAVALLRESVKRRKADPNALRELREHLKKQN
jgi:tetratricopeptide (TPR) repeat protein